MDEDAALEQQLRRAVERFDPIPPRLARVAIDAFTWRTIDAELAELVFDSLVTAASVRGAGEARLLTFETGTLTIELEVSSAAGPTTAPGSVVAPDARRVSGRLIPAQRAEVEVQAGDLQVSGAADELGRFALIVAGSGPLRLKCRPEGQISPVVTEWVVA